MAMIGNGDDQTLHGGHQRGGDATGQQFGVAGAELGDDVEGLDHAGHGAEQTEQWRDGGDHHDEGTEAIQMRRFVQDRFGNDVFQMLAVAVQIAQRGGDHAGSRTLETFGEPLKRLAARMASSMRLACTAGATLSMMA